MAITILLRAITTLTLLVKIEEKIIVGSPLTIFVSHAVEALLNSHHTQHFSARRLLLCSFFNCLLHNYFKYNNFYLLSLSLLLPTVPHDCLILRDYILTLCNDMHEIPLGNTDFSWFTDSFYLKGNNDKYCAEFTTRNPFVVSEATSLHTATFAQQAKLCTLT